jgi:hypothetical protein
MATKLFNLFSKVSYTVVLASFLLPFLTIKCQDQDIATATGFELITGNIKMKGMDEMGNMFGKSTPTESTNKKAESKDNHKMKEASPNFYAIGIFILGLIGLALSFMKMQAKNKLLIGVSALGIVLLFVLSYTAGTGSDLGELNDNPIPIADSIKVKMQEGFYVCLVGFLITFAEPIISVFKDDEYME